VIPNSYIYDYSDGKPWAYASLSTKFYTEPEMSRIFYSAIIAIMILISPQVTLASETDVIDVKITKTRDTFRFDVTLRHADTGWDHYANKWEIVGSDGAVLGTRILAHPHVNEQPFTRSLGGVTLGKDVKEVLIRAGDNLGETGGKSLKVIIPE
jgi:hypothetical protein